MKQKAQVVILPTKVSRLALQGPIKKLIYEDKPVDRMFHSPQHLYFTSKKYKQGDWIIRNNIVFKATIVDMDEVDVVSILATTNESLRLEIPSIQQSFLKSYVKSNGSIKEVWVEQEEIYSERLINPMDKECSPTESFETGNYKLKLTSNNEVCVVEPMYVMNVMEGMLGELKESDVISGDKELEDAAKEYVDRVCKVDINDEKYKAKTDFKEGFKAAQQKNENDAIEFAKWTYAQKEYQKATFNRWRKLNTQTTLSYQQLYQLWKTRNK